MNTQVKTRRGGVQSCIFGNMFDRSPPPIPSGMCHVSQSNLPLPLTIAYFLMPPLDRIRPKKRPPTG